MENKKQRLSLVLTEVSIALFFILLPIVGSKLISYGIKPDYAWFASLKRPWFTPPRMVFGPVWTFLYLTMGISSYLYYLNTEFRPSLPGWIIYTAQLVLNWMFYPIYFGLKLLVLASVTTTTVGVLVFFNCILFFRLQRLSGIMLIPYLLWSILAATIAVNIVILNPDKV
ncbi:hypothetical protein Ciccas_005656 [Cichlidogyrus casuarinus]|uniref:Translocator protein n=1 Tax=Cichlidogyrus casuarinus TaxID=1844966 RepID=A0ABD2Q823_9PLAT